MNPDITFVVCTLNRAEKLEALLHSIPLDELREYIASVIIIDNGSTDNTQEIIERWKSLQLCDVITSYVHERNHAVVKTMAIHMAKSPKILYCDNDCLLLKGYIKSMSKALDSFDYCGGRGVVVGVGDPTIGSTLYRKTRIIRPFSIPLPGTIMGASMGFRRTVMETVGSFDPLLAQDGLGADDTDYVQRCSLLGFTGIALATAVIHHQHDRHDPQSIAQCLRVYDLGRGGLYAKRLMEGRVSILLRWICHSMGRGLRRGLRRGWNAFRDEMEGYRRYRIAQRKVINSN